MARIRENALEIPVLKILAGNGTGEATTSELVSALTAQLHPTGRDADILDGRHDTYFSQKVRNLVSHRHSQSSFVARGDVEYTGNGLRITPQGRKRVKI